MLCVLTRPGVAVSDDGIGWRRGQGSVAGARGADKDADVGRVLEPNQDEWWWLDTRHLSVSDVQARSRPCAAHSQPLQRPSAAACPCAFWATGACHQQ